MISGGIVRKQRACAAAREVNVCKAACYVYDSALNEQQKGQAGLSSPTRRQAVLRLKGEGAKRGRGVLQAASKSTIKFLEPTLRPSNGQAE